MSALKPRIQCPQGRWAVVALVMADGADPQGWLGANGEVLTSPERMTRGRAMKVALDYLGVNR